MAVVNYTKKDHHWVDGRAAILYEWSGLHLNDTGQPVLLPTHGDVTIQILSGTPGSGLSVHLEGTLDDATTPTSYGTLNSATNGNTINLGTVGALDVALQHPLQYRPNVVGGDGSTNIVVRLLAIRPWRE